MAAIDIPSAPGGNMAIRIVCAIALAAGMALAGRALAQEHQHPTAAPDTTHQHAAPDSAAHPEHHHGAPAAAPGHGEHGEHGADHGIGALYGGYPMTRE